MKKNENPVLFNHGYLCEMLRSASKIDLERVLDDVAKEKQRRDTAQKLSCQANIHNAIDEAIQAGYEINLYFEDSGNSTFITIHDNNVHNLNIKVF